MKKHPQQITVTVSSSAASRERQVEQVLEWINFNDRSPQAEETVLLATADGIAIGRMDMEGVIKTEFMPTGQAWAVRRGHVFTHWATLPPPPVRPNLTNGKQPMQQKYVQLGFWS